MEIRIAKTICSQTTKIKSFYSTRSRSTVELAHTTYGPSNAIPIIVLHGLFGSKANWKTVCTKLNSSTNRPVISADLRNHGDSPFADSHSYMDLAGDVSDLMQKLGMKEATLLGHSMGGRTAMVLALNQPTKVTSLIVVDISPATSPNQLSDYMPRLMAVMQTVNFKVENLTKAKEAARHTLVTSGIVDEEGMINWLLMNVREKGGKFGWRFNLDVLKKNFDNITAFPSEVSGKVYQGPTLFIAGQQSHFVPPSDLPAIKKIFPQADLHYIQQAGHNVHMDNTESFLNVVNTFLKEYSLK